MKSNHTMKPGHTQICAVLLAVGVLLLATGAGDGGLALLPFLGCALMMSAMMWMMMRPGRNDGDDG